MIINFGYVAISLGLKDASPNKTITLKNISKIDRDKWEDKLNTLSKLNIENTIRILKYNHAYGINLYRFTSKLIPLATHPELSDWLWRETLAWKFQELGNVVRETGIRVSTHPDHFTLLNSPRKEVLEASRKDLVYHNSIFELMGLGTEYKIVIHIGGMYKNKGDSIKRFYEGFQSLDEVIKKRIILENDDKLYNSEDVLNICSNLHIPMVLDVHHDRCNPSSYKIKEIINDIFKTWEGEIFLPKIHISSPKSEKDIRSHHDYVDAEDLLRFISEIKNKSWDFDTMVEAKKKDEALFKLMEDISKYDYIEKIGDATIRVK